VAGNTNAPRSTPLTSARVLSFAAQEGAALFVTASSEGDGGTLFVAEAAVPGAPPRGTNTADGAVRRSSSPWSTNAPFMPPQIAVAMEDYNRLVRMIRQGEQLKMTVDLRVQFHTADPMASAARIYAVVDGLSVLAAVGPAVDYTAVRDLVFTNAERELGVAAGGLHP